MLKNITKKVSNLNYIIYNEKSETFIDSPNLDLNSEEIEERYSNVSKNTTDFNIT